MSEVSAAMNLEDMLSELEEDYECAGFAGIYERVLSKMTEDEIRKLYHENFEVQVDREFEEWERRYNGE